MEILERPTASQLKALKAHRFATVSLPVRFPHGDYPAVFTYASLRFHDLTMKFISLGVDPKDLDEFAELKYDDGFHAGEEAVTLG